MQILEDIRELFRNGDPEPRKWFLVGNNYLPFIVCFSYVFVTVIGTSFMKNREPWKVRKVMIIFNFSVVLVYIIGLIITLYHVPKVPWVCWCNKCELRKGESTYTIASIAWFVYILKYFQFLDTMFFIVRKKEHLVSFLHVFHHSVVPLIAWLLFRTERNGMQFFPIILNTLVHVVMYTYYGMAAMGPKMRKYLWWKKYLTQMQIIQFVLIIVYASVLAPASGCPMAISGYIVHAIFGPLFLFLFYNFYKTTFRPASKKEC